MILCYHKVHPEVRSYWYVSIDKFNRDMAALQAYDVVYLADYDPQNPRHAVITFDGIYDNIAEYALPILKKWKYPFELFVVGDTVGRDNGFDQTVEPPCNFASLDQLKELVANGGRIQWHTASHKRLQNLSDEDLARELTPSTELRSVFASPHLDWFAYPHGDFDQSAVDGVAERFKGALACDVGDDEDYYRLTRLLLAEKHDLFKTRISVVVHNHNSGHRLVECLESVLKQTIAPDEILLVDDASTDASQSLLYLYADRVRVIRNDQAIGTEGIFHKSLSLSSGDYVAFVESGTRLRSDFVEQMRTALDRNPDATTAYSDIVLFGDNAPTAATEVGATRMGESRREGSGIFLWEKPDFAATLHVDLKQHIPYGASIFRRQSWLNTERSAFTATSTEPAIIPQATVFGTGALYLPLPLLECGLFSLDGTQRPSLLEQTALEWRRGFIASQVRNDKLLSDLSETTAFTDKLHHDIHELKDAILRLEAANAELRESKQHLKMQIKEMRMKNSKAQKNTQNGSPSLLRRIRDAAGRFIQR